MPAIRTNVRFTIPEAILNIHPHDGAAKIPLHPIHDTYPWKFPKSYKPETPIIVWGIDYLFGAQQSGGNTVSMKNQTHIED